jgi:hypothetical protein
MVPHMAHLPITEADCSFTKQRTGIPTEVKKQEVTDTPFMSRTARCMGASYTSERSDSSDDGPEANARCWNTLRTEVEQDCTGASRQVFTVAWLLRWRRSIAGRIEERVHIVSTIVRVEEKG